MFDIDSAIEKWKQSFDSVDALRPDDVLELESHLRELVSELRKRKLSDREAFMVATQRLGNAAELNGEFAKVNGATVWQKRVLWMLCGYVVYSVGSAVIQTAATLETPEYGETQMWRAIGGLTVHLCVFAASVVLIWALSEPKVEEVETTA